MTTPWSSTSSRPSRPAPNCSVDLAVPTAGSTGSDPARSHPHDEGVQHVTTREAVVAARRVVVKVGSSSLTSADGGLDVDAVDALVETLAAHRAAGTDIVLVSSGAIAAGLAPLGLTQRPRDLASQQA